MQGLYLQHNQLTHLAALREAVLRHLPLQVLTLAPTQPQTLTLSFSLALTLTLALALILILTLTLTLPPAAAEPRARWQSVRSSGGLRTALEPYPSSQP